MNILYIKALHIIFVVTWFAGLFYIVRLFIYHTEAEEKPEEEKNILQNQYKIMEKRLWYYITWPSAILTLSFGFWLVSAYDFWTQPWMLLKLSLVFGLFLYHLKCHQIFQQLQINIVKWTSVKLRMWNEIATLFLFAIVFIVVLKNLTQWYWGLLGIVIIGVLMMMIVKLYKNKRTNLGGDNNQKKSL